MNNATTLEYFTAAGTGGNGVFYRSAQLVTSYINRVVVSCFVLGAGKQSQNRDWLRVARQRGCSSSPSKVEIVLFFTSPRSVLWSIQPSVKCVPGLFPRCLSGRVEKLPRSRKLGSMHSLPRTSSWRGA
jgi:hypothetical protein